jgi:hypothetical protein
MVIGVGEGSTFLKKHLSKNQSSPSFRPEAGSPILYIDASEEMLIQIGGLE